MGFDSKFIDDLKTRLNVSDVVGRKVKLQRKGNRYLGLCPFHNEKTPSFNVSDEKEFYHCFGCGEHGDVFSFLMKTEGVSFIESVQILANEAGMQMPVQSVQEKQKQQQRIGLYEVCELACQYFQKQLFSNNGKKALEYVKSRKINQEMIMDFRLGYSDEQMGLIDYLKKCNVPEDAIISAGLARKGDNGLYSFFRDRLMFPITDVRGKVIAFGGRFMGDSKAKGVGKYINSPETPLFDKSNSLYNLKNARKSSYEAGKMIVCEGYMDVISLTQAGFPYSVAPLGTALTEKHIMQVWKSVDLPVLCFDGDEAGQKAATRSTERILPILSAGKSVKIAFMPDGCDPDDIIQNQGAGEMKRILNKSVSLPDYLWSLGNAKISVNTPEQLAKLEKHFTDLSFSITDKNISSNYRSWFNNLIWENHKKRKGNFKKSGYKDKYLKPLGANVMNNVKLPTTQQKVMLAGIINYPEIFHDLEEKLFNFFDNNYLNLFGKICNILSNNEVCSETLKNKLYKLGFENELNQILDEKIYQIAKPTMPNLKPDSCRELLLHMIDVFVAKLEEQVYQERIRQSLLEGKEDVEQIEAEAKLSTRLIYTHNE